MSRGRRQAGSRAVCWPRGSGGKTPMFFPTMAGRISVSGMSHPFPLFSAFVLAVPMPGALFLYLLSPPNWLILPTTIVLTVQIFAATSPPPGSLAGCPQAGSGASSELLHCPVPSLQPTHTKSPLPRHRVLPVFSSVSPVNNTFLK